eukprot:Amastigsp_a8203_25.p3 type:complete len:126 gc:universal Amastigsp_a8203_25:1392-1015(-)
MSSHGPLTRVKKRFLGSLHHPSGSPVPSKVNGFSKRPSVVSDRIRENSAGLTLGRSLLDRTSRSRFSRLRRLVGSSEMRFEKKSRSFNLESSPIHCGIALILLSQRRRLSSVGASARMNSGTAVS